MKAQLEVLHLLFSETRADILRLLFSGTKRRCYVRELTILTGLALRTIQEELATMDAIGLVTSWSNGYYRFYRANRGHSLFANFVRHPSNKRAPFVPQAAITSPATSSILSGNASVALPPMPPC